MSSASNNRPIANATSPAMSRGARQLVSAERVAAEQLPESLRMLADPSQEILVAERPRFNQLAPVPLRQLGTDTVVAGEAYLPASEHRLP